MESLALTVEPIPVTSAGKSLNRLLSKGRWDRIRKKVYADHGHRCAICGVDPMHAPTKVYPRRAPRLTDPVLIETYGERIERFRNEPPPRRPRRVRLECHEEWAYDEATGEQRLLGLAALCTRCHHVKHWQWARTHSMPPSWWAEERKANYRGPRLRKGGPYRGLWYDEQRFALFRAYNPHEYLLEDHFMWVNDCDLETLREHVTHAAEVCFERSHHDWRVDFGEYAAGLVG